MARRRQTGYDADYDDGGAPPPRMRRRRSSSPNGVLIALAIAGVVGIVFFFIVSSGASGDEEIAAAKTRLRDIFETFVKNQPKRGSEMLDPRQILADIQKAEMKGWNEMTDQQKQEKRLEAWNLLKTRVEGDTRFEGLGVDSMAGVDATMSTMTWEWNPAIGEVVAHWDVLGAPWRARLQKNRDGTFTLLEFRLWK